MNARYLFPADYMADPAAHVWNGRIWIYPSHDRESGIPERDNGDHFDMVDYHALSIEPDAEGRLDPMTGAVVDHGVILDLAGVPWAKREPIAGSYSIDPCCFRDPKTGAHYLVFGGIWGGQLQRYRGNKAVFSAAEDTLPDGTRCALEPADAEPALCPKIARLADDMRSFAGPPVDLVIVDENGEPLRSGDHARRFFEASWLYFKDGKYHFAYSTGDTHLVCDAVSDALEGPYRYDRVLLEPQVGWTTHHCVTEVDGKWYLFHHDSAPSGGRTWLRSLKVKPLP